MTDQRTTPCGCRITTLAAEDEHYSYQQGVVWHPATDCPHYRHGAPWYGVPIRSCKHSGPIPPDAGSTLTTALSLLTRPVGTLELRRGMRVLLPQGFVRTVGVIRPSGWEANDGKQIFHIYYEGPEPAGWGQGNTGTTSSTWTVFTD